MRRRDGKVMRMARRRIVVTGSGVVSSIGAGVAEFWPRLVSGTLGIKRIEGIDQVYRSQLACLLGPLAPEFSTAPGTLDPAAALVLQGCAEALEASRVDLAREYNPRRVGVSIGTSLGAIQTYEYLDALWLKEGLDAIPPHLFYRFPAPQIATNVCRKYGLNGPSSVVMTACAAGAMAIGQAVDWIRWGRCDAALTGGVDLFSMMSLSGFNSLHSLAPQRCQPFDKNRDGLMLGEAMAMMVLEEAEAAERRGAPILAEISGFGLSCDAEHMTIPAADGRGAAQAMQRALDDAGLKPQDIDYINAHGTGTGPNDRMETLAIKAVFGDWAKSLYVSSSKSMLGHTLGAAGAVEALATLLAVVTDTIPPTANLEEPDPECDLNYVPNVGIQHRVRHALTNSFAFGGNNAALVFSKWRDGKAGGEQVA
ncbi:MAG: beta-ketoacyl-[acyl-carrier-protein] synthase family protein [Acetobacteraceae bacterium]|nr:beta-ketoacyl-[acyl-carrier-protein] synthase family protein [Acetobacteraceae bacterium]